MRCETLIILSTLLAGFCSCVAAQELQPPALIIPPFDAVEERQAEATANSAGTARQEIPRESIDFIRGIVLLLQNDMGTRLRFLPKVTLAEARLTNFSLRRISHLKGKPVQEFGDGFEQLIRRRVGPENKNLSTRINTALEKKPERLEIPFDVAGWFSGVEP